MFKEKSRGSVIHSRPSIWITELPCGKFGTFVVVYMVSDLVLSTDLVMSILGLVPLFKCTEIFTFNISPSVLFVFATEHKIF